MRTEDKKMKLRGEILMVNQNYWVMIEGELKFQLIERFVYT